MDSNISIQALAKKLDSNSKYISDVINTYKNKNFTAYINEMRINYIKEKLNEEKVYRSYKIKYLAEESGFSSHSVFSSVFKSIEGVSPAQYIQLLK
ncbi:helix-turn-helix domain-containing protein [Chryseobacterium proteolyticum]|uniref:helix-turn-helix domain-containing protein n=1 Tax=Chryseobacterium proteolyticum TaxID=118127 RepID=UPI00398381DD